MFTAITIAAGKYIQDQLGGKLTGTQVFIILGTIFAAAVEDVLLIKFML
jgi:hypothetical protein